MPEFNNYYDNLNPTTKKYFAILYPKIPIELKEYVEVIIRLKNIDYFCGMRYASPHLYNFKYNFSRLDHSINCALETLRFTTDFEIVLSALYHDAFTPIFSHVIDYLYNDHIKQEKSEEQNAKLLIENEHLNKLLDRDNYNIERIVNPKNHSIVDANRPKLCIDRLDGILLTSLSWTKTIDLNDVDNIINNICLLKNNDNTLEIGCLTIELAQKLVTLEKEINKYCHSKEDTFMMSLGADLIKHCLNNGYIIEEELFLLDELEFISRIKEYLPDDLELAFLYDAFTKTEKINEFINIKTKKRILKPLYLDTKYKVKRLN